MIIKKIIPVVAVILSIFLSGCAINPKPLTLNEIVASARKDEALIRMSQEEIKSSITLEQAMARALKYNLDNRVQLMQEALSNKSFDLVKMDMLPTLAVSAGYMDRSNVDASISRSVLTDQISLEPSTSVEQERHFSDMRFSWNILDFGVSYLQSKQESDRYLISKQGRKMVMLKLLQQTRRSFWRAIAMQKLDGEVTALLKDANIALGNLRQLRKEQLRVPINTLQNLRTLLDLVFQLEQMQKSVNAANVELTSFINVSPGMKLKLDSSQELPELPAPPKNMSDLEIVALTNSADYTIQMYNVRIDQREARKALLRLLPALEFSYLGNYDSNSFLYNSNWWQAGIRVTWNIFRLLSYDRIKAHNDVRQYLSEAKRLAVNMAVVAKMHLAWQQYSNALSGLARSGEIESVDRDISQIKAHALASQATSSINSIQSNVRTLKSRMRSLIAYADAQAQYGNLLLSLGVNPVPDQYQVLSVDELGMYLKENFTMDKLKN